MRPSHGSPLIVGVLLALGCSTPIWAQPSTSGTIRGYVKDQQGAVLEDVKLTASSPDVARDRQTSSAPDGGYALKELPPGTYVITAERQGFARYTQPDIRIGAGLTLGLDITLQISAVTEAVDVAQVAPMIDISRPGQITNISGDFQKNTPLRRTRTWDQFFEAVPGITGYDGQDGRLVSFRGSGMESHVLQLDGSDFADALSGASNNVNLSTDAIADVQVKSATADASVPLGFGAIANVVSRSGTNRLQGSASLVYQSRKWNDSNVSGGSPAAISLFQPDASLGGPIQRDNAWFFVSYRRNRIERGIARSVSQVTSLRALEPGFTLFNNVTVGNVLLGKVEQRVRDHTFAFSYQYDRTPAGANEAIMGSPFLNVVTGGPRYALSLTSIFTPTLVGHFTSSYNTKGSASDIDGPKTLPARYVYERASVGAGVYGVGLLGVFDSLAGFVDSLYSKFTAAADLTHTHSGLFGQHDLTFGGQIQDNIEGSQIRYVNGGLARVDEVLRTANDPAGGTVPFRRVQYTPDRAQFGKARARDISGYIQDFWRPHRRVTVSVGLRVDQIHRRDLIFDKQVQDSVELGPRGGVTVALDDASRNVVYAAVGRIHGSLWETNATFGGGTATITNSYDRNFDGTFETTLVIPGSTLISNSRRYDSDLHQPHVNEASVGYRHQFWGQTAVDVAWFRRGYRDIKTTVEVNGIYQNQVFVGYRDETQNEIGFLTNNVWNWPLYDDISVQVSRRSSRLQIIGSYTRQWQRLRGSWQPNDISSFLQPDAFPDSHSSPSQWRDHTLRLAGTLALPGQFRVSGSYSVQTGAWSGPIETELAAPDPTFGPDTVTLSNGRDVSNPLATTTRFAYARRGDGQLRADTLHMLNLRVARDFALLGGNVQVWGDLFNLANAAADQEFDSTNLASSSFGIGTNRQVPRSGLVGLRVSF